MLQTEFAFITILKRCFMLTFSRLSAVPDGRVSDVGMRQHKPDTSASIRRVRRPETG